MQLRIGQSKAAGNDVQGYAVLLEAAGILQSLLGSSFCFTFCFTFCQAFRFAFRQTFLPALLILSFHDADGVTVLA